LIEAVLRCQVELLLTCAISNFQHTVVYDRWRRYPEFVERFHKIFARSQNALRGRWENLWASEQVCVVKLVGRDAVLDKLVYTATNPVQDHLSRTCRWRRREAALGLALTGARRYMTPARRPRCAQVRSSDAIGWLRRYRRVHLRTRYLALYAYKHRAAVEALTPPATS
jgi:hypothetical protein